MDYLPPYLIQGTHRMTTEDIEQAALRYERLLAALHDDRVAYDDVRAHDTMNAALAPLLAGEVSA